MCQCLCLRCVSLHCTVCFVCQVLIPLSSPKSPITLPWWSSCLCIFQTEVYKKKCPSCKFSSLCFVYRWVNLQSGWHIQSAQCRFVGSSGPPRYVAPYSTTLLHSKCVDRFDGWLLSQAIPFTTQDNHHKVSDLSE